MTPVQDRRSFRAPIQTNGDNEDTGGICDGINMDEMHSDPTDNSTDTDTDPNMRWTGHGKANSEYNNPTRKGGTASISSTWA